MTPTPASSLGVRDAAGVTPAADLSRGSVEGLGRRGLPPGVTVTRCFQRYTAEHCALRASSFRLGQRQRAAIGEHFYTASNVPGIAFPTRGQARRAAISAAGGE
jgi:hypothetical protein